MSWQQYTGHQIKTVADVGGRVGLIESSASYIVHGPMPLGGRSGCFPVSSRFEVRGWRSEVGGSRLKVRVSSPESRGVANSIID
jgi:hypothetical protein